MDNGFYLDNGFTGGNFTNWGFDGFYQNYPWVPLLYTAPASVSTTLLRMLTGMGI